MEWKYWKTEEKSKAKLKHNFSLDNTFSIKITSHIVHLFDLLFIDKPKSISLFPSQVHPIES